MSNFNIYGDSAKSKTRGRGVDIASQRFDDLDQAALLYVQDFLSRRDNPPNVIDLGGGFGSMSARFALDGANVTFVDFDATQAQENFKQIENPLDDIRIIETDFKDLAIGDLGERIDVLYSQRAIHYISYQDAHRLLMSISNLMPSGARLFLSAAGCETEYGKTYPHRDRPVQERFAMVSPEMREKHHIWSPIVTYSKNDLAQLIESSGFVVDDINVSGFGNVKAMGSKP